LRVGLNYIIDNMLYNFYAFVDNCLGFCMNLTAVITIVIYTSFSSYTVTIPEMEPFHFNN